VVGFDRGENCPASSPESETLPEKRSSVGCSRKEIAVKSRSHDATTLPRRQTSATSARLKSY